MEFLGYISEKEFHKIIKLQFLSYIQILFIVTSQLQIEEDFLQYKLIQT